MSHALATREASVPAELQEKVLLGGDLARLTPAERLSYYNAVCQSVGLNPLTRPFEYLALSGKLVLYARKDCTDQLRKKHEVSVVPGSLRSTRLDDVYIVTVCMQDKTGRTDEATGAVTVGTLKGDALANALMKAETKAKRRCTLSICGLGILDETEIDTIQGAHPIPQDRQEDGLDRAASQDVLPPPASQEAPADIFAQSSALADHELALKEAAEQGNEELNRAWDACKADPRLTSESRHPLFQLMTKLAKGIKKK